jgi:hypothetical protein
MDIPIIVWSLADSLALADVSVLPLPFEPDLIATLDIGIDDDSKCQRVPTYYCTWWLARKPRNLDSIKIMDQLSIDRCLEVHQLLLLPSQRGGVIDSGSTLMMPSAPLLATLKANCSQCGQYRDLLGGILHELLTVHQISSAMSAASENQWSLDMCQASTFNLLHKVAVIKECGPSTWSPQGNKGERAKGVQEKAQEELQCLQALPPSSHKWTLGEQLMKADILGLARSGTWPAKIHSGYDVSLKGGKNSLLHCHYLSLTDISRKCRTTLLIFPMPLSPAPPTSQTSGIVCMIPSALRSLRVIQSHLQPSVVAVCCQELQRIKHRPQHRSSTTGTSAGVYSGASTCSIGAKPGQYLVLRL